MDDQELTPWEEINPPRRTEESGETALQLQQPWNSFGQWVCAEDAVAELTQSLALVAPVGMTVEDRTQWLTVAAASIVEAKLSAADLRYAAKKARLDPECDHPAKIVSSIMRALGDDWRPMAAPIDLSRPALPAPAKVPVPPPAPLTAEELAKAYARLGEPALKMALKFGEADEATCDAIRRGDYAEQIAA